MNSIKKIKFLKKKIIINPKGNILKYIKKNDKNYLKFGEVYFTWIKKRNIKGLKYHKKMYMNLTVPVGSVKFIFYDKNFKKKVEYRLSEKKFGTLFVPPKIWYAFTNLSKNKHSLVVNFSNIIHDKNETINKDFKRLKNSLHKSK